MRVNGIHGREAHGPTPQSGRTRASQHNASRHSCDTSSAPCGRIGATAAAAASFAQSGNNRTEQTGVTKSHALIVMITVVMLSKSSESWQHVSNYFAPLLQPTVNFLSVCSGLVRLVCKSRPSAHPTPARTLALPAFPFRPIIIRIQAQILPRLLLISNFFCARIIFRLF